MTFRRFPIALVLTFLIACTYGAQAETTEPAERGTLIVAGGAIADDNDPLYQAFLDAMPDTGPATIAIVSAASGSPVSSANWYRDKFIELGVPAEQVSVVRLAVMDDAETPDTDERLWRHNVDAEEEVARIAEATAIWFTGGDQSRLTELLLDGDKVTAMLRKMRARLEAGGVIGGTSAGAAIMSDPMITGGETLAALGADGGVLEPLSMGPGLGFLPFALVDQHFDARARLGRLVVALGRMEPGRRLGIGVDEDTAFVYSVDEHALRVVGSGNVTIIDGRGARWLKEGERAVIVGLRVFVLSPGDRFDIAGMTLEPASYRKPTVDNEYHDHVPATGAGIAAASPPLVTMLGEDLLDNSMTMRLVRPSFHWSGEGTAPGVAYRFTQLPSSQGFWGRGPGGSGRYSIADVELDIIPVDIEIRRP